MIASEIITVQSKEDQVGINCVESKIYYQTQVYYDY